MFENEETKSGRVVVIDVPPRPIGRVFKFEDVPLMRVGEELKPMSDFQYCKIIQEQEPDFSQQICDGVTIADLNDRAIQVMREKYAEKQHNAQFKTLSKEQILSDLDLVTKDGVTNAAVILLGRDEVLKDKLPQASVRVEYRASESQISFDNRVDYRKAFFLMIEELWHDINLRNGSFSVREGPYIFNVPYFNEDVIREAINNAVAHRDYRRQSETVIKLYPQRMTIVNAGGFPQGVTLQNLLTVPSTPRNRLLTDVLSKTGIVERSGQGVDKIFYETLSEGKAAPDYSHSDDFKVELTLSVAMRDRGFALFVESIQQALPDDKKLSVFEVLTLVKIRDGVPACELDKDVVKQLLDRKLIERYGKTRGIVYTLCRSYYDFTGDPAEYLRKSDWGIDQMIPIIAPFLEKYTQAKMGDFVKLLDGHMTRRQIRVYVQKLVEQKVLTITGVGSGTRYKLSDEFKKKSEVIEEALQIGLETMARRNGMKSVQNGV